MSTKRAVGEHILPVVMITFIMVEWINVLFIGGLIGVVSWWSILFSSIIGVIIFILLTIKIAVKLIKQKKIRPLIFIMVVISLLMAFPVCWFFGIGNIPYPADVTSVMPTASIRLPINKTTVVGWGGDSLETNRPHVIVPMERWAYDLLVEPYSVKSDNLDDYGIYGVEVVAPANGTIVAVYDDEKDILPGTEDNKTMAGNYIYMQLDETQTYLVLTHLKQGSILVKAGQHVTEGTPIARVGNSGATSEPHLHIHHQRQNPSTTSIFFSEGLPLYFRDIEGSAMPTGGDDGDVISPIAKIHN